MSSKTVREIQERLGGARVTGNGDVEQVVTDLTVDSREVKPGTMFICVKGEHVNGHDYLPQAYKAGARVALVTQDTFFAGDMLFVRTRLIHKVMRKLSAWFYDNPSTEMRIIGVTGTNGKTTTTNLVYHLLKAAGHKVGLIGTIDIRYGDRVITSHNTTPDTVLLQKILREMADAQCEYVVMEVSSHALDQGRVSNVEYDVAALTNITQDHLDYHGTFAKYVAAKALLFKALTQYHSKDKKCAVLNSDDPSSDEMLRQITSRQVRVLRYGRDSANDIYPLRSVFHAKGMELTLHTPQGQLELQLALTGDFNVYNVMTAVGIVLNEGVDLNTIKRGLSAFKGVPGRFELIQAGQPYTVIVDYAHTPDGLDNVLSTARKITQGKLWVVFGCGGDRDATKRPIMGRLALEGADKIIVTCDNPRSEEPEAIFADIMRGMQGEHPGKEIYTIADRREAICYALSHAEKQDVVLIAGKGHENYQIFATETIHFSDREVVETYWRDKKCN